jgi:N-acetylglucosamine-6-phosphate deacetylase
MAMNSPALLLITNGTLVTPRVVLPGGAVLVSGGRIAWLGRAGEAPALPPHCQVLDAQGGFIAPGFVDIHLHGGGGADVMDGTADAIRTIAQTHAAGGTTAFVGSTVTAPLERLLAVMDAAAEATSVPTGGAELVGVHLEGPFLAPGQVGAHDPNYRRDPQGTSYHQLLERGAGVRRLTLAPELPGASDLIRAAVRQGWHVSMGHSDATGHSVIQAMGAGCRHVTHLFCCTSAMRNERGYKQLGINEYALIYDDLTAELISDGHHLSGEMATLVVRRKGAAHTCLVTDAMRAAGMPPGVYDLGGIAVLVEGGVAKLPDRSRFAGSVATMAQLVREMAYGGGLGLLEAITTASLTPARLVGIERRKGSLDVGKDGDIVVLSPDLGVRATTVKGMVVYRGEPRP